MSSSVSTNYMKRRETYTHFKIKMNVCVCMHFLYYRNCSLLTDSRCSAKVFCMACAKSTPNKDSVIKELSWAVSVWSPRYTSNICCRKRKWRVMSNEHRHHPCTGSLPTLKPMSTRRLHIFSNENHIWLSSIAGCFLTFSFLQPSYWLSELIRLL